MRLESLFVVVILLQLADNTALTSGKGTFAPYKAGAPDLELDASDMNQLNKGITVKRQFVDPESGEGSALAIQIVYASPEIVLDRITDFSSYPKMVSGVVDCHNYVEIIHPNKTQTLLTKMIFKTGGFLKFNGYFHHTFFPTLSSVTWTLDYDKSSDFVDSVGYWYVESHPGTSNNSSIVYYSIKLLPAAWIPTFAVNILKNQALGQATSWVKYESEKISKILQTKEETNIKTNLKQKGVPPQSTFECIWWELYSDLLHDKVKPLACYVMTEIAILENVENTEDLINSIEFNSIDESSLWGLFPYLFGLTVNMFNYIFQQFHSLGKHYSLI